MPAKKTTLTDAERRKRIRETARKVEASDDAQVVVRALKRISQPSKRGKGRSA